MSDFTIYDASVPIFVAALGNMKAWLTKAAEHEALLMAAALAPDMATFPRQYQMASDTAKNAMARLTGATAPSMPDIEASFAELVDRCDRTIGYIQSFDRDALTDTATRAVEMRFPNGMGYAWSGSTFLTGFAIPNFFFHVTTAYAILRANGVPLGKLDYLQHLGRPNLT